MKICITGGTGFLGKWLVELAPSYMDCVVLSRSTDIEITDLKVIKTDYSYESLKNIFHNQSFDAIVHLVGRKIKEEYSFLDYIDANTLLTDKILRLCTEFSVDNVITASSRMVYSSQNTLPWSEKESPKPMTYYGLSKLYNDKLISFYNNNYALKCKSLRFAQIFGIDLGSERIHTRLFRNFIDRAMKKKPLRIYGEGEDKKEYIYVKDAVKAIISALETPDKYGVFNIGMGENNTVLDIAELINEVFENEKNGYEFLREKDEKDENVLLDITKSKEVLNFEPNWSIREALYDIQEMIENGYVKFS